MSDLISRQAAIDAVQQHREDVLGGYKYDEGVAFVYAAAHNHIIRVIKQLPSVERHGRWIRTGEDGYCSICNCDMPMYKEDWEWRYLETPYCPNCGARMEVVTE